MQKKILFTILNWGLGHATRCIPIIDALQKRGHEVIIASDGRSLQLLEKEYPQLEIISLPPYDVSYHTNNMFLNIAPQLPKILWAIWKERKAIKNIVKTHHIDIIISDNRFGCYHPNIKSIFITHQVNILVNFSPIQSIVRFFNKQFIKKYDECWIPDMPTTPNLSGILGHSHLPKNAKHIGVLSRFKRLNKTKKWDILIVLSGPEPQRTYFEQILLLQAQTLVDYKILVVKGKPEQTLAIQLAPHVEVVSFMTAKALNEAMESSDIVVARSGYSTLMDLVKLNKKAILIPTTGQTEQEYLADIFHQQGIYFSQRQEHFNLKEAILKSKNYKGLEYFNHDLLEEAIYLIEN